MSITPSHHLHQTLNLSITEHYQHGQQAEAYVSIFRDHIPRMWHNNINPILQQVYGRENAGDPGRGEQRADPHQGCRA